MALRASDGRAGRITMFLEELPPELVGPYAAR
jgi:hypothetical protein